MNRRDIPIRTNISELIPFWDRLTNEAKIKIKVEIDAEWWRGYYAGREAEANEAAGRME